MRSPNYPTTGLPEAIEMARKVWKKEKRTPTGVDQLAEALGFKSVSGPTSSKISAMKKFGLLESAGKGKWRLTDRTLAILHKPKITNDYKDAIQAAINDVGLFSELLRTHGDASTDNLKAHLIVDKGFTEDGAARFVKAFNSTKSLAISVESGIISPEGESENGPIKVGDFVQWTSQEVDQFDKPRRVTSISDGGEWAFVDGSKTGIAVEELSVELVDDTRMRTPPPNPDYKPPVDTLALPVVDGSAVSIVTIPKMSATAFQFFKEQLETYKSAIVRGDPAQGDEKKAGE